MMGMGGMMGMSCTHTIRVSTAGLMPGSTHTLIALLVDNLHVPLMPLVAARVTVRIGGGTPLPRPKTRSRRGRPRPPEGGGVGARPLLAPPPPPWLPQVGLGLRRA